MTIYKSKIILLCVLGLICISTSVSARVRMWSAFTVSGTPMHKKAEKVATGWSLGQSPNSIIRFSDSNTTVHAGLWSTFWLLTPPPPPPIVIPLHVASGTTGVFETAQETLCISGRKLPSNTYRFSCATYSDAQEPLLPNPSDNTWSQEISLTPGEMYEIAYYNSNTFARSSTVTLLIIDAVPECTWAIPLIGIILAVFYLRKRSCYTLACICILLIPGIVPSKTYAAPIRMNYQGVIEMDGGAYHGIGFFKFAIRNAGSTNNIWANDGHDAGEPLVSVRTDITNGSFRVVMGGFNMMPLHNTIFLTDKELLLYVWFSRVSIGPYELIADGEPLYTVPYAANAYAIGNITPDAIITTQSIVAVTNAVVHDVISTSSNYFLLKSGDTCTGTLGASNLISETDITVENGDVFLSDQRRVFFDNGQTAYIATATNGALTIYNNGKPALEFE